MKEKIKRLKNRIHKNKTVYRITAYLVFFSIIIILANKLLQQSFPKNELINSWISPVLVFLATSIISYAIGQVVLSFFDIINFVQNRISEVIFTKKFIRLLNDDTKREIKKDIETDLYNTNNPVYFKFQKSFEDCLCKSENVFYYKKHTNMVNCDITEIDGIRYRRLKNIRTIVFGKKNMNSDVLLEEVIKYNYKDIPKLKEQDIFNLEKVVLCTDDQEKKELSFTTKSLTNTDTKFNKSIYNKTAIGVLTDPINLEDNLKIEITYSAVEPLIDYSYVTRLDKFCCDFSITFTYNKDVFDVCYQTFGFGLVPYSNKKDVKVLENQIKIDIGKSSFPGDGTIFTIIPK